jgi:acetolactate synthase I/II/III large subunit
MKVSDYLVKFLQEKGIKNVYILVGGAIMHIVDSLGKSDINIIPFMHEQSAGIAAEAESIYKNDVSVLITTAGPGILNAINPITSAWIDGNPMLIISGQCKTADSMIGTGLRQKGVQEVNAVEILKPITILSVTTNQYNLKFWLDASFDLFSLGCKKGPIFLEIPLDIQNEEIDLNEEQYIRPDLEPFNIDENTNKLIELLNNSERPVILAGNGIRKSGALEQFKELINSLGIPILLTWKSLDFISEDHIYNFGRPGSISSRYANSILQTCDLLISIGARMDYPTVAYDYNNFAPNAKKVIVDIDKNEINKLAFEKELVFNCDAKIFLEKLIKNKNKINKIDLEKIKWLHYCIELKEKHPICLPEYYESETFVNPYVFIEELSKQLNSDDIIVAASSGSASEMMCQTFKIKEAQRFICSNGLGSMGYGLPAAIGACFASDKKRRVILVEGEGSFNMNLQELELVKRYNLPIVMFIWNNNGYKSIRDTHQKFFGNVVASDKESGLTFPELCNIASAYKLYSMIIEVMIDPLFQTQPKVQSFVDDEGKMQSGKLENMWPFLEEDK